MALIWQIKDAEERARAAEIEAARSRDTDDIQNQRDCFPCAVRFVPGVKRLTFDSAAE